MLKKRNKKIKPKKSNLKDYGGWFTEELDDEEELDVMPSLESVKEEVKEGKRYWSWHHVSY